jgi:DNA-binding NarL/FixJ family response regulator
MTTVALVEDSAPLRRNLERMLRRAPGVRCICSCGTAEAALEQIPRSRPDVVLMDINLPGASGIECTPALVAVARHAGHHADGDEDTASIFAPWKAGACAIC